MRWYAVVPLGTLCGGVITADWFVIATWLVVAAWHDGWGGCEGGGDGEHSYDAG